jgi:HK97 gp10 family phage protein
MAGSTVNYKGISVKLVWYGDEREKEITIATGKGMIKCGLAIERDAKRMCPVDTGRLRASISTNWSTSGMVYGKVENKAFGADGVSMPVNEGFSVKVGTRVEYAEYLEHGTFRMGGAQPFLFPAYEYNKKRLPEYIKGEKVGKMGLA